MEDDYLPIDNISSVDGVQPWWFFDPPCTTIFMAMTYFKLVLIFRNNKKSLFIIMELTCKNKELGSRDALQYLDFEVAYYLQGWRKF